MPDARIEAAKVWLAGQAELLAQKRGLAVSTIWHGQGPDFDQHRQALKLTVGENFAICRFSEFDLQYIPVDGAVTAKALHHVSEKIEDLASTVEAGAQRRPPG